MIRRILPIILFALLAFATNGQELKYLLAVDSSHSMLSRKPAVVKLTRELIAGGFDDNILPGDKFSVWVYNEQNYWNRFPIQTWGSEKPELLGEIGAQFIASEVFEKQTRFEAVAFDLTRLIVAHPNLVILLVTDGESPISGIDFDIEVNMELAAQRKSLPQERKLFVVSLLALNGKLQSWRVFPIGTEIKLPRLPRPQKAIMAEKPAATPREAELMAMLESEKRKNAETTNKLKEDTKPPVVFDMPPGAKIFTPKPSEISAAANIPFNPIIDSLAELKAEGESGMIVVASTKASATISPQTIDKSVNARKPENSLLAKSNMVVGVASTSKVPTSHKSDLTAGTNQKLPAVAPSATVESHTESATEGARHEAVAPAKPLQAEKISKAQLPASVTHAPAAKTQLPIEDGKISGMTLAIYISGGLVLLMLIGVAVFLLHRRASLRGSIISQSYSLR